MTIVEPAAEHLSWYTMTGGGGGGAAGRQPGTRAGRRRGDPAAGRVRAQRAADRAAAEPSGRWPGAQLANPMNIMLLIVGVASFAIGQVATGAGGAGAGDVQRRHGLEPGAEGAGERGGAGPAAGPARPGAAIRRGRGDRVDRAGARGRRAARGRRRRPGGRRILSSASLEVQEAALTGESAPVTKDRTTLPEGEIALGDRTNLVFQNTQVTRGTATFVVTATGQATEMGQIADMVTGDEADPVAAAAGARRHDQGVRPRRLAGRGGDRRSSVSPGARTPQTLLLLCVSTAIASIPTGLPTFVQAMLSSGARRLAESKAVVKSLTDVETLGGTTVINSDKTGTLTMNAMTATTMLAGGDWYTIEGAGYREDRRDPGRGRGTLPDFRRLALGLTLCTDATVGDDGTVIGDPTEAAFVVLAAKMGADAERDPRRPAAPGRGAVRLRVQVHGDVPRPPRLAGRRDAAAAALRQREGRARRRRRALQPGPVARRAGADRRPCATRSWRPTGSSPSGGCGCWRSRPGTSTTRRCPRRSPTRWPR